MIAAVGSVALLAISAVLFCVLSKAGLCRREHRSSLASKGTSDEGEPPETSGAPRGRPLYANVFEDTLSDDDVRPFL
jgi:hypothetical protein